MKKNMLIKTNNMVIMRSPNYNFDFNMHTGFFARWGKTKDDDPDYSPYGCEIVDCEIDTRCHGAGKVCDFCYKKNNSTGEYMSLETFKKLHSILPPTVTQIAFGIGDLPNEDGSRGNPDMWDIFQYCRDNKIVPNVTINGEGTTDDVADKLAYYCGAVAVSAYDNDKTFNSIKKLTDRGMDQINIHFFLANETFEKAKRLIDVRFNDDRLAKMNAIVFLSLKQKGRAVGRYTRLPQDKFDELVKYALDRDVPLGFDSCSAAKFMKAVNDDPKYAPYIEPCESSLFSSYFSVKGDFFPCSFMEGEDDWVDGIKLDDIQNFHKDLWFNEKVVKFRNSVINCRTCKQSCVHYDI